jgi:hypothetical protein
VLNIVGVTVVFSVCSEIIVDTSASYDGITFLHDYTFVIVGFMTADTSATVVTIEPLMIFASR